MNPSPISLALAGRLAALLALLAAPALHADSWALPAVVTASGPSDGSLLGPSAQAMRVFKVSESGVPLLQNGGFEQVENGQVAPWRGWHQGFVAAPNGGRNGSAGVQCERLEGQGEWGASQTLRLDRTNVAPLVIRGWSKAESVSGSPDNGYSLYVDLIYQDGTPLWGRTAPFNCGTHDWERRQFVLLPEKPIQSLTLHCLFRGHTGKVWFDDVSVEELPTPANTVLFHGLAVEPARASPHGGKLGPSLKTADGLSLRLASGAVAALRVNGHNLAGDAPSGFLARDVTAESDFCSFSNQACSDLDLRLNVQWQARKDHIAIQGRVSDMREQDRAITLLFALPIDAAGWQWGDDLRRSRTIERASEFASTIAVKCGSGRMSRYPFGAIWNAQAGIGLGLNLAQPAQYTIAYHPGTRQFFLAYDLALVKETARFPSSAEFSFVLFSFDPQWGFRAALQKYYDIFPDDFARRVKREGTWMPFTDIARVPGFQDFGFAFQEGAPNVPFDDLHGIYSFVYVEPMSYWLALPPETPRTYAGALDVLKKDLAGARDPEKKQMAAATLTSGIQTPDNQFALYLVKAPWCDGGVFTLNPDPEIATSAELPATKATAMQSAIAAAFQKNPATRTAAPDAGLDGVYFDSLEMSGLELNYRRDHFRTAHSPLVFDAERRPAQLMILDTLAFVRSTAQDLHRRGLLTFANGALWNFAFPAPLLDVMGTEVNWMPGGHYSPDSDAVMNFRRALCRQKPYCLLMNTDYTRFTPEYVEQYFNRCLFYGVWPGFFDQEAASKDPYWASSAKWYDRDRALFKRYIPLLRMTTTAGWQPIPGAVCDNPQLWLERFGGPGRFLLTVFNDTAQVQSGVISVQNAQSKARKSLPMKVLHGQPAEQGERGWRIQLPPQHTAVLEFSPR